MSKLTQERTQSAPTQAKMSAWTPLFNKSFNKKIFQERFELVKKWYAAWSEDQRWQLVEYILLHLSDKDILFLHSLINPLFPPPPPPPPVETREDFTRILPRFLSLKIFSYLDPQSLCRAAKVCWYWHDLCQQNVLWKPMCLRFGWFLPSPANHSNPNTIWKRHYVSCVLNMFWRPPKPPPPSSPTLATPSSSPEPAATAVESRLVEKKSPARMKLVHSNTHHSDALVQPLWKHSCRFPKDLVKTSLSRSISAAEDRKRRIKAKSQPGLLSTPKNTLSFTPFQTDDYDISLPDNRMSDSGENDIPEQHLPTQNSGLIPVKAMLDPCLIEKIRLGDPSEDSLLVSTINSKEPGPILADRVEHLQIKAPFPKLKPYYVEANKDDNSENQSVSTIRFKEDLSTDFQQHRERDKTHQRKDFVFVSVDSTQSSRLSTEKKVAGLDTQQSGSPSGIDNSQRKLELERQSNQKVCDNEDCTDVRQWTQQDFEEDLSSESEVY